MALVLVATVGAANANALLDATAAQAIMDATPNADAWTAATSPARDQALVYGTSMLNVLAYKGVKATIAQALQWPRASVRDPDYGQDVSNVGYKLSGGDWGVWIDYTTIPVRMQRGCAMLALEILRAGTTDIWGVEDTANIARKQVDVIATEFVPVGQRRYGLRSFPSVWREIYPLTLASEAASVQRA
jgi:hypothetical protein